MEEEKVVLSPRRWYRTGWGITIIVVGGIVLIGAIFFSYNVIKFYQMIKQGKGGELAEKYNSTTSQVDPQIMALRLELETGDYPYLGSKEAPITIVAFLDYKCPFCIEEAPTLYRLGQNYSDKVKIIIRDFPSDSLHPGATEVAKMANCAYKMGFYWPAFNWIFNNQDLLPTSTAVSDASATQFANEFGVDVSQFLTCYHSPEIARKVNENFGNGYRFGARGTPTFFINGEQAQGAIEYKIWEGYVKQLGN